MAAATREDESVAFIASMELSPIALASSTTAAMAAWCRKPVYA
jgi:hypothetical protein